MPPLLNTEVFQMEHLRSSPSQQHLEPSRSSSLSQPDEMEQNESRLAGERPHKLDLYSIPVFLLEVLVLLGLAYSAYFIHFEYKHNPLITGFYCDDISLRQPFTETKFVQQFTRPDNEIVIVVLLLAVPIVAIIFCELVNSMFGSLKFRQVRAFCTCCKLHSITRRTFRFAGAYALGFLIVMISCDILANTSGRFRPYLAQECPALYHNCDFSNARNSESPAGPSAQALTAPSSFAGPAEAGHIQTLSAPISDASNSSPIIGAPQVAHVAGSLLNRVRRDTIDRRLIERKWINLVGTNMTLECEFFGDSVQTRKFEQLAMSWPSFPAAVFTYACLFVACYLSFVGTARPFRMVTCVLVMVLLLLATIFNTWLVKTHYQHWEDVAASMVLALAVVVFVVVVYLNYFRDTHYYEKQKLHPVKRRLANQDSFRGYNNELAMGQYSLDKTESPARGDNLQNGDTGGSISNNDLAMRYFQIPRANYRGAPRPLSSLNQMRS